MNEKTIRLQSKNQNIHYTLTVQTGWVEPKWNRVKIFIFNSACNKYTKTWADLSGTGGEVALASSEWEGYRYIVPKWVREVIKTELEEAL